MTRRWWLAAAALAGAAIGLIFVEPLVLGPLLGARRGGPLSLALQQAPVILAWTAAAAAAIALGWLPAPRRPRITRAATLAWLTRGVPVIGPRTVAVFRVLFGTGVLLVLRDYPIAEPSWLAPLTRTALVLFALGFFARTALAVAAVGVYGWMSLWTAHFGSHPVSTLVLALPCLCFVPWSDTWSLDAVLRRTRPGPPSPRYGYAVWMPLLIVGVACFAAAWAKLITPGWIVNGTVKFAFVADAHRASVPWGLWIASHDAAAVAASAAAVVIEALIITSVFVRSPAPRLLVGVLTATVFAGFYLFQGELWRGWWLLFLGFLPWDVLSRRIERPLDAVFAAEPTFARLTRAQLAVAAFVVLQQIVASAAHLEIPPAFSAYDMYSTTFPTTAAFDRANPMYRYRYEAITADGAAADLTDCFGVPATPAEALAWREDTEALRGWLEACHLALPAGARSLRLYQSLQTFDWSAGTFGWAYRDREVWTIAWPL